jgi:hypothetical protein
MNHVPVTEKAWSWLSTMMSMSGVACGGEVAGTDGEEDGVGVCVAVGAATAVFEGDGICVGVWVGVDEGRSLGVDVGAWVSVGGVVAASSTVARATALLGVGGGASPQLRSRHRHGTRSQYRLIRCSVLILSP